MKWKVPLNDLWLTEEDIRAVSEVLQGGWIGMGGQVTDFENEFAKRLGAGSVCAAVNSGTAALHTAMHMLGIGEGDEVIVPSLTFIASAACIRMVGAIPVFADSVGLNDFGIDPLDIENKITLRTKAIIVVHYGGFSADMEAILDIAHKRNIRVVEDVAHGPFVKTTSGYLGTLGDVGCFSFHATKNITTAEGGMVVCQEEKLRRKALSFRSHGMETGQNLEDKEKQYEVEELGMNYRMTDIAAALGRSELRTFNQRQSHRLRLSKLYRERLADIPRLSIPYAHVPLTSSGLHIMPILLDEECSRLELQDKLMQSGIQSRVHYPACHTFAYYIKHGYSRHGDCPMAKRIASRQLTLPLHTRMSDEMVHEVCDALARIMEAG